MATSLVRGASVSVMAPRYEVAFTFKCERTTFEALLGELGKEALDAAFSQDAEVPWLAHQAEKCPQAAV